MCKVIDKTTEMECIKINCSLIHSGRKHTCRTWIRILEITHPCTHALIHACTHACIHVCVHAWCLLAHEQVRTQIQTSSNTIKILQIYVLWIKYTQIYMNRCKGCWKPNGFITTISVAQWLFIWGVRKVATDFTNNLLLSHWNED